MTERQIEVLVDEGYLEKYNKSCIRVQLNIDGVETTGMIFSRDVSPETISGILNEVGCYIKYDETDLSEAEKQRLGDAHIDASYRVPGLGKN